MSHLVASCSCGAKTSRPKEKKSFIAAHTGGFRWEPAPEDKAYGGAQVLHIAKDHYGRPFSARQLKKLGIA